MQAHLSVGEVKNQVLPLVPDVVFLEAEEEPDPVEEVHAVIPGGERRFAKVVGASEGGRGGADLRVPEGRMVHERVVDWDDVVGLGV